MSNRIRIKRLLIVPLHLWCLLGLLTEYPCVINIFLNLRCFYTVALCLASKCQDVVAGLQQSLLSVAMDQQAGSPQDGSTAALPKRVPQACLSSSLCPRAYSVSEWLRPQSFVHFILVEGRRSCLENPWTAAARSGGTEALPVVPAAVPRLQPSSAGQHALSGEAGTWATGLRLRNFMFNKTAVKALYRMVSFTCLSAFGIFTSTHQQVFFLLSHKVKLSLK